MKILAADSESLVALSEPPEYPFANRLALVVAVVGVAGGLYLSLGMELIACPLCYYQRAFLMTAAGILLLGLGRPADIPVACVAMFGMLPTVSGMAVASWHSYLVASGRMECPAGIAGLGAAPYQSLITFLVLATALCVSMRRNRLGARCRKVIGTVILASLTGWACIKSAATPVPAAPSNPGVPLKTCRLIPLATAAR